MSAEDEFVVGIATGAGAVDYHPCTSREDAVAQRALFAAVFPGATVWIALKADAEAYKPQALHQERGEAS
ncbi:hypothetical protein [Streptomyces sp. NBC_00140]|uniref:hypothetical protein n=1 Tax=Streptomyces sp. NBC_00140 TaxID=2975664 RepID=UPI0022579F0F|nr:hypothetical protein [Streptomyces sp. NBC_00140]MCX5336955.1 hypothetical protein [Streptomyces sp. NBC_00140]MCX5338438.1 hypothetical protein [Streptomyces sp. NBC_00140]